MAIRYGSILFGHLCFVNLVRTSLALALPLALKVGEVQAKPPRSVVRGLES